ncbi:hypothetical protein ACH5RR_013048 [Cinchona calisaya]|uniref:Uncharacterized protein n=1 Tax=Cinchona calisaya TaxID=153742 RepID=A0ABD2ZYZ6_9GENT
MDDDWHQVRIWVFGVVLAGILLFPQDDGRICLKAARMMCTLYKAMGGCNLTLISRFGRGSDPMGSKLIKWKAPPALYTMPYKFLPLPGILMCIPPLSYYFLRTSWVIIVGTKQGQTETDFEEEMSHLFIGMTSTEGPSTASSFGLIEEKALKNWTKEYLPTKRDFW